MNPEQFWTSQDGQILTVKSKDERTVALTLAFWPRHPAEFEFMKTQAAALRFTLRSSFARIGIELIVERTTPGSYFMACGWSGGYFGVQELGNGQRVAIFSVLDPTKGDDPKAVRPEDRVELLHEGAGVRIKRFGGEGTGGQCMTDFAWEVGEIGRAHV